MAYHLLKSEPGPDFGLFKIRFDHQQNQRNNYILRAIVVEAKDSANVVAITPDQEIILVRQYRFGIQKETLEIPGGMVEGGEDIQAACARELLEETGYSSNSWHAIGTIQSNPVFMNNLLHQFIATDVVLTNEHLDLDPGEQIEVVKMPIPKVKELILNRTIQHPHTLTALMQYFWQNEIR